jgi:uncharacterized membrane protein YeaQ/YmgE (transglycosylase-associated protein family)
MLRTGVPHIQWSRADCPWFRGLDVAVALNLSVPVPTRLDDSSGRPIERDRHKSWDQEQETKRQSRNTSQAWSIRPAPKRAVELRMSILWTIIIGLIAGVIAKLIHSGPNEPTDFILTTLLGIAGVFAATYLGQAIACMCSLHARPKAAHGSHLIVFQPTAIVDQASLGSDSRYSGSRVLRRVRATHTHGDRCGIAVWNVGASARRSSPGFLG